MVLTALVCDGNGNSRGLLLTKILSCDATVESLDQFPSHTLVVDGADRRTVGAINVLDTIKINDSNIGAPPYGVVAWGVIMDPNQQINDSGNQIHITLLDITEQARWTDTGLGWVAATGIGAITHRLGTLAPNWDATFTDTTGLINSAFPAVWTPLNGYTVVTPEGSGIVKGGGAAAAFDTGAITQQSLSGKPCAFSFRAVEVNTYRVAGLSGGYSLYSPNDIKAGIFLNPTLDIHAVPVVGAFNIWESGTLRYTGAYTAGDIFTIYIDGTNHIHYYKNGTEIPGFTSAVVPTFPLYGMAWLYTNQTTNGIATQSTIDSAFLNAQTTPDQSWWAVRYEKETILGALQQLATNSFRHLRTARDANGSPMRKFELGSFGTTSAIRLGSPDGFASAMKLSPNFRIISDIDRKRDGKKLTNAVTPLGANSGTTQVDLEFAWRMQFDDGAPASINPPLPARPPFQYYIGNFPPTQSPFPEYDANYPIARKPTLDGRYEYYMTTALSDVTPGTTMWSKFEDSQFTYVDTTLANQIITARALYVSAKAALQWDGYIHETITVVADGVGRPPRAGDLVEVYYKKTGNDVRGAYTEFIVNDYYVVMQVTRRYDITGRASDTYTLTKHGRWDETQGSVAADSQRQLQALRMVPSTNVAMFPVIYGPRSIADGGAQHDYSVVVPVVLPTQAFRVQTASLRVDMLPIRSTVSAAGVITGNSAGATGYYSGTSPFGTASASIVGGGTGSGFASGVTANPNGFTTTMQGGVNGSYTGPVIGAVSGNTWSGGVVNNPYGLAKTSGILYNPHGGNTTSGSSKATAGLSDITYPGGSSSITPSTTITAATANAIEDAIRKHNHTLTINSGGDPDSAGHTRYLYGQSGGGVFGTDHIQAIGSANYIVGTNFDGDFSATSLHGHVAATSTIDLSHTTNIDGTHDYTHAHDFGHSNDMDHKQWIDHYHTMPHTHSIDHTHYIDHYHLFPHTHQMVPGVFESLSPSTVQVWIDNGSGAPVDISPYLYDTNSQSYGPFTSSFSIADISQWVNYPGRTVKIIIKSIGGASNPLGLGEVFVYGTWIVELSGVASVIYAQ